MEVSELAHHGPEDLFISIVMFLGSFFILIGINVELTLIVFTILPIIVIYAISQRKRMKLWRSLYEMKQRFWYLQRLLKLELMCLIQRLF